MLEPNGVGHWLLSRKMHKGTCTYKSDCMVQMRTTPPAASLELKPRVDVVALPEPTATRVSSQCRRQARSSHHAKIGSSCTCRPKSASVHSQGTLLRAQRESLKHAQPQDQGPVRCPWPTEALQPPRSSYTPKPALATSTRRAQASEGAGETGTAKKRRHLVPSALSCALR